MYKKGVIVLTLFCSLGILAENIDDLPEKYVPKVIIEAKWGYGPGEFGLDLSSAPYTAPGGISVDDNGDIYILDNANGRIQRFDKNGKLLNIFKVSSYGLFFGVKDGIIYSGGTLPDTLVIINTESGKETFVKLSLPGARSWVRSVPTGYIRDGELIIEQATLELETKRWRLNRIDKGLATFIELSDALVKTIEKDITIGDKKGKEIIIKKGTEPQEVDGDGNYYFEKWWFSETSKIIKISSEGKLISIVNLPIENYIIDDFIPRNPDITISGDIYYLYPTGQIIVENWKKKFIPGKVQVIKWELQKLDRR